MTMAVCRCTRKVATRFRELSRWNYPLYNLGYPSASSLCRRLNAPLGTYRPRCFALGLTSARNYNSERGDEERSRNVRAYSFQIMNPFTWLRIKLNVFYIRSKIDAGFTLESFMLGAAQAFRVLLLCLTNNDYASLDGLVSREAMAWIRENYQGAEPNADFDLSCLEEFMVRKPKQVSIESVDDNLTRVYVDTLFAAVKIRDKPYLITGVLRFQRDYTRDQKPSDWIISEIHQLMVKDVGSISF